MGFVATSEGQWSFVKPRAAVPSEPNADVSPPLTFEEKVKFSRLIGERREKWR